MTRMTPDERRALELQIGALLDEADRLRALLAVEPVVDDTVQVAHLLCDCGLPANHRNPRRGDPRPCADETARIALPGRRQRLPELPGLDDLRRRVRTTFGTENGRVIPEGPMHVEPYTGDES